MSIIALLVLIMVVVFLYMVTRRGNAENEMDAVLDHRERQRETRLAHGQRGLDRLQAADPDFDPQAFIELANGAMHRAWDSWKQSTPEQVRRYISDSAWDEYTQMMTAISALQRRATHDAPTYTLLISAAIHDGDREQVTIEAEVAGAGGAAAWQSSGEVVDAATMWLERWVWERNLAADHNDGGCIQCGAALEELDWRCPRCGVPVTPRPHEWHVIRIGRVSMERLRGQRPEPMAAPLLPVPGGEVTQLGEELHADSVQLASDQLGIAQIEAHDPDFDETDCIAVAMEMINEVLIAWQRDQLGDLEQWTTPALARDIRQRADLYHTRRLNNRLPQFEISQVVVARAGSDERLDRIDLGVRGRGANIDVDAHGVTVSGIEAPAMWAEVWRLQRSSHATSVTVAGAERCPRCGAPRTTDDAGSCEFCGDKVDADSFGWRFSLVAPLE